MENRYRRAVSLMEGWSFRMPGEESRLVNLPHSWNCVDGQDGGNDYKRLSCEYERELMLLHFDRENERVYIEFDGVNSSCELYINDEYIGSHDGGYSSFRFEITDKLRERNRLRVVADNSVNDRVYPQKADFTFYGGIYRELRLLIVPRHHFSLSYYGGNGMKLSPRPVRDYRDGELGVELWCESPDGAIELIVRDREGNMLLSEEAELKDGKAKALLVLPEAHLWDGINDPYLYTIEAGLKINGRTVDTQSRRFGIRDFHVDSERGFFLNGRSYPLHGVSRHQDRKGLGNAISDKEHREDMELIRELGANSIRLAHYQHSQYFYELCDELGMVVWAEIPYISEHLENGRENSINQMKELIVQNHHHASICFWGISNEITISTRNHGDMMENHRELNELCHKMDSSRLTTLACYAACPPWDPVVHRVSDLVGYNYYLGWYTPFLWLNDLILKAFHLIYPKRRLCYSEYGAEAMPNLHSRRPKRGDHSEEYQLKYLEYMLKCFDRHRWMWADYLWNMFDFAADARNQGGEPGMNHKGLVSFDRKTKKDSFYLYKAWWSKEPFLHICGKRRAEREERISEIKIYSNQNRISLYSNGRLVCEKSGSRVFNFRLPMEEVVELRAVSGNLEDRAVFKRVDRANPSYRLNKKQSSSANWT